MQDIFGIVFTLCEFPDVAVQQIPGREEDRFELLFSLMHICYIINSRVIRYLQDEDLFFRGTHPPYYQIINPVTGGSAFFPACVKGLYDNQ